MASAMRVRNLFTPLIFKEDISIKNIIITYPEKGNQFENCLKNENIEFRIVSYNLYNIISVFNYFLQSLLAIKQMKQNGSYNVLYVYGYPDLEKIFIILFAKIFHYKILFDINEDIFSYNNFSGLKARISTYSSLILIKKFSSFANGAIAISSHLKELLDNISKNKFPVELISISVDFGNFTQIINNKDDNIKLFYGGSFGEKDGIDILLDAFETISILFPNVILVMTGKGPKRYIDKLLKLIEKNSSKDRIFYKGCLPLNEYYSALSNCDIMCMTRTGSAFANGGFPFKLGEYLASGKAVIASDVSDIKYYLKDKINAILIEPDSKDALVKAIELLITDRDLRNKIGEEGRQTAKKYFDNYSVAEKFISFVETKMLKI